LPASRRTRAPSRPSSRKSATRFPCSSAAASAISIPSSAVSTTVSAYVIIGTAAVKNPGFLHDACVAFPGHIIVGLDAKDGKVAVDGWSKLTGHDVIDLAKKYEDYGVEGIIYTDIGRDGMLSGINIEATVKLAQALRIPVIASGGLSNLDDIRQLCAVESEGVAGTIAGRAVYDGSLDFAKAQKLADELGAK
jgi:phosphoribosylformimino-5-aminoimidazole carboxamide ribotide isomerase